MRGHRVAKQDNGLALNVEKALPARQLSTARAVQRLHSNAETHDCTPWKAGVVSVVPSARSSSVVAPIFSVILPPAGTSSL